jgi:hypothetical protein
LNNLPQIYLFDYFCSCPKFQPLGFSTVEKNNRKNKFAETIIYRLGKLFNPEQTGFNPAGKYCFGGLPVDIQSTLYFSKIIIENDCTVVNRLKDFESSQSLAGRPFH